MLRRRIISFMLLGAIVGLSIPAIIHSTQGNRDASRDDPSIKLPEVVTIGPESGRYVLTQNEREKLSRLIREAVQSEPLVLEDGATIAPPGEYTGLTETELQKKRQYPVQVRPNRGFVPDKESFATIEEVPRASGFEGLTDLEKAKWKAWKNSPTNAPRRDPGE